MAKQSKLLSVVRGMKQVLNVPLTVKMRTGMSTDKPFAHDLFPQLEKCGADALTIHGRSRKQRYTKFSDWDYIGKCSKTVSIPVVGNGDVFSFTEFYEHLENPNLSGVMIGRGALIKPWIFKEIKDKKHYDISSSERLDVLKTFAKYGLDHWVKLIQKLNQ
jgi:tRNA-dihydrouridine synthase 3